MNHQTDFCILGAGLAGLSLADSLQAMDLAVTVIEKSSIAAGASGTPGGLVNPATGRRATKVWKAEPCYDAISANLEKIQAGFARSFYSQNGLLRPALLKKMARKMKDRYETTRWPEGWCQWKSENEIKEMHPGIQCIDGGLWLPIGLSVDVGTYLKAYAEHLSKSGISLYLNQPPVRIAPDGKQWIVELEQSAVRAANLVFATGHGTLESSYWDWLPLHFIKGQVATFRLPGGSLSFDHSISSLGYIARTGSSDTLVQGSTYEHDFENLMPDAEGAQYLRKRMRKTLPALEKKVTLEGQWAGVRTSTPNKKPILGRHPHYGNLHIFTGLGSKGLMYSKFLADHYTRHLSQGTPLLPEVGIGRLKKNET